MALAENIQSGFTRIGTEFKTIRAHILGQVGNLANLQTSAKTNLVAAINEIREAAASATGIDDGTTSTLSTWSSSKINTAITAIAPTWASVTGKPATFPPTIGTTAATAKAGNYTPAWGDVTSKPAFATVATSGSYADLTGTVPTAALPPLAVNDVFPVASQAAMLALTAQRGDVAIRSDNSRTYILATDSPATLADWKEITASGSVQTVAGKTGTVTLVKGDVGLGNVDNTSDVNKPISSATQTALNAKPNLGTAAGTAVDAGTIGNVSINYVTTFEAALL